MNTTLVVLNKLTNTFPDRSTLWTTLTRLEHGRIDMSDWYVWFDIVWIELSEFVMFFDMFGDTRDQLEEFLLGLGAKITHSDVG